MAADWVSCVSISCIFSRNYNSYYFRHINLQNGPSTIAKSLYETPTENHGQLCSSKQTSIQDDEYNYHDPMQANIIES